MEYVCYFWYNINMTKKEKHTCLINSMARSMEAEGFDFKAVKAILEKKLQALDK